MHDERMMCTSPCPTVRTGILITLTALWLAAGGVLGCKDLTGGQELPSGTVNPDSYKTQAGARGMRTAAIYALEKALPAYIMDTGLLTDEFQSTNIGASAGAILVTTLPVGGSLDARTLPEIAYGAGTGPADRDYTNLQNARADIIQSIGAMSLYDTTAVGGILRSELYSLEGFTEISLADFFCSGVPLSTLDFERDYTYRASSTTAQVYQDALTKLDTALTLADTSTQQQYLAQVLRGRAWLALGEYDSAQAAVAGVPTDFRYQLEFQGDFSSTSNWLNYAFGATVSDREGVNGLPYLSGQDPRTPIVNTFSNSYHIQLTYPARFSTAFGTSFSQFPVATGIEAGLIRAEAAYHASDPATMITLLNTLRATATVLGQTTPVPDTLTDPGTDSARVALLFRERAYWLFATAHRQGDFRRELRQYSQWFRTDNMVYPTGAYPAPGTPTYGSDVTAPIPGNEYLNPLFGGCLDRGA